MKKVFSNIFLVIAVICFLSATFLIYKKYQNKNVYVDQKTVQELYSGQAIYKKPVFIKIRTLDISLPIIESSIKKGVWETNDKGVSYLLNSPLPGESGNSILYGHNFPGLLGKLKNIQRDNEIEILFNNGEVKRFVVKATSTTGSKSLHILKQTQDTRITIYTCTGFMDSKRFVVTAVPKKDTQVLN
ncbi:MAG: sortase [Patescibacteria group bacterium]